MLLNKSVAIVGLAVGLVVLLGFLLESQLLAKNPSDREQPCEQALQRVLEAQAGFYQDIKLAVVPSPTPEAVVSSEPVYDEAKPTYWSQSGEDKYMHEKYFRGVRNGFFVEAGGLDGVWGSNTLFFARYLGWRGVLIEPIPKSFEEMKRNRQLDSTCLNMGICEQFGTVEFVFNWLGAVSGRPEDMSPDFKDKWHKDMASESRVNVTCLPLGAALRLAGVVNIDIFFLDIEGGELVALKGMDWSIPVRFWVIEMDGSAPEREAEIRSLLQYRGYRLVEKMGDNRNELFEFVGTYITLWDPLAGARVRNAT